MQVYNYRGRKEFGVRCSQVVSNCGKRVVLDPGLSPNSGRVDMNCLSDIPGLDGSDDSLLAILISRPHLGHICLLGHMPVNIPVIMGYNARKVIIKAGPFVRGEWPAPCCDLIFTSEKSIEIGPFRITPFRNENLGFDAYSLLIEADGKRFYYDSDCSMQMPKAKQEDKPTDRFPKMIRDHHSGSRIYTDI